MKTIKDIEGIKRFDPVKQTYELLPTPPLKDLGERGSFTRTPLIFLVDGSWTMTKVLEQINNSLLYLHDLLKEKSSGMSLDKVLDLAVIVFAKNASLPTGIDYQKAFDLIGDIPFALTECRGTTPLGEAMLHAYLYGVARKGQYRHNGFDYTQPIVVLLSDLGENASGSYMIDGKEYAGRELYEEMAELYDYQMNELRKQYTFVVPLGEVSEENKAPLANVDFRATADSSVDEMLNAILREYVASARQNIDGGGIDKKMAGRNTYVLDENPILTDTIDPGDPDDDIEIKATNYFEELMKKLVGSQETSLDR